MPLRMFKSASEARQREEGQASRWGPLPRGWTSVHGEKWARDRVREKERLGERNRITEKQRG